VTSERIPLLKCIFFIEIQKDLGSGDILVFIQKTAFSGPKYILFKKLPKITGVVSNK